MPGRGLRGRVAVSSTLVAGLELARAGVVALDQDTPWAPIRVLHLDDRSAVQDGFGPLA
jgi:chromatin segregation and condensation protein Rec8/ScpA/Scc1 (kleisin family)